MGQEIPFTSMATLAAFERFLCDHGAMVYEPDRRRFAPRVPVDKPASLGVMVNAYEYRAVRQGWCTEISRAGIGLILEEEFAPLREEALFVSIDEVVGQDCLLPVRLIYCKQILPRTYRLGATFLC